MAIKAFLGLGNPGKEYEKTYHNVGKWAEGELGRMYEPEVDLGSDLITQEVFMNQSSAAARMVLRNKPYTIESVLVIHDDSDLLVGQYKLVLGGGSAGHKGVQDLIDQYGTENFWRLRIGIRDPKEQVRRKALEFVLNKWSVADEVLFKEALTRAWEELTSKELL